MLTSRRLSCSCPCMSVAPEPNAPSPYSVAHSNKWAGQTEVLLASVIFYFGYSGNLDRINSVGRGSNAFGAPDPAHLTFAT